MARRTRRLTPSVGGNEREPGEVIPLGKEPPPAPPVRTSRPRGLHGIAIALSATFALTALLSFIGYATVHWSEKSGRVVLAIFMFSIVGLLASIAASVLTAARATYISYRPADPGPEADEHD